MKIRSHLMIKERGKLMLTRDVWKLPAAKHHIWYPDMKGYDQFVKDNDIATSKLTEVEVAQADEVNTQATEEPVYEQVPVQ